MADILSFKGYGKLLLLIVFIGFLYTSYKIIAPFLGAVLAAIVLSIVAHPMYDKIAKKTRRKNFSAFLTILIVLIIIIVPGIFFANSLVHEAISLHNAVGNLDLYEHSERLKEITGLNVDFAGYAEEVLQTISNIFIESGSNIIRFIATGFIHIFTAFFVMFFLLRDGRPIVNSLKKTLPLSPYQKIRLFKGIVDLVNGIFTGFLFLAIAEFIASLIGFYFLGIPSPVLWALLVAILVYIPLLGASLVWIPAAIYLFVIGEEIKAVALIIYFSIVVSFYMENILRAHLMKRTAKIHPIVSVLGIFGGIVLFGVIGIVIGPLILALFVLMYKLYEEENDTA